MHLGPGLSPDLNICPSTQYFHLGLNQHHHLHVSQSSLLPHLSMLPSAQPKPWQSFMIPPLPSHPTTIQRTNPDEKPEGFHCSLLTHCSTRLEGLSQSPILIFTTSILRMRDLRPRREKHFPMVTQKIHRVRWKLGLHPQLARLGFPLKLV